MTIRDISKDINHPTIVKRAVKNSLEAAIAGLPSDVRILESTLAWSAITEIDLTTLKEAAVGIIMSQGNSQWTINRRSIPAGIFLVKFTATYTVGDPASPETLKAFNYGFIKVISAPVRAVIDGGSSVRWGSVGIVSVDGSLSYDEDIGLGNHTGLNFIWSCLDSEDNDSVSHNCFSSFHGVVNSMSTTISIDPGQLETGKTYVLRLNVSKAERSSLAEMSFQIIDGEIPHVALRWTLSLTTPCTEINYKTVQ